MKDYPSNETFNEKDFLSLEKITETMDCMVDMGIKGLQITGGGEPLIHPQADKFFKYAVDKKLEIALVSNGQLLTEDLCNLLGDAAWVRISMDSSSPQLYSFLRNVHQNIFYQVCNNIKTLVKYRRKSIIGVGFVVERENYKEIYEAARRYKDMGIDNFRISAAFTPMGYDYFKDFMTEAQELSKKAESLTDNNFTVFNLFNDRIRDCFEGRQDYNFCPIKDLLSYVGSDYNVYTCCTLAYNTRGLIGSIKNQTFKDLWDSQQKRDKFSVHNPAIHCQHPCMYKNKNEFINYCIKKDPKHVNFI
jgi:MoaA/NifB/PqqE/SkfB family radical SAM enzyme